MILNKLYTSPVELFKPIEFHSGLNLIYAHNDNDNDPNSSPHSVGKSTVLDLILFALLFEFSDKSSRRLFNAYNKKILNGISIVLEFSVDKNQYKLTRSFDNPNYKIYFGRIGGQRQAYSIGKLRDELYKLIFARKDYQGLEKPFWYYKLFSFFIKVKRREELFSDPIEFSRNFNDLELTPFHLFLLNINNTLPYKHMDLLESIQSIDSRIKEQEKLLKEISKTKDLTDLENKRNKLKYDIMTLEKRVNAFTLIESYPEQEKKADELTAEIKNLWFKNTVDRKKLEELKEFEKSLPTEVYDNLDNIINIYNEVNSLLAGNVKKSIQDAMGFRKSLHRSRRDFVTTEKGRLNTNIYSRGEKLKKFEEERNKILSDLSEQKALTDLTNTYQRLSKLQYEFGEIEYSLGTIDKLKNDLTEKRNEHSALLSNINKYLEEIFPDINNFRELLLSVFNTLFLDNHKVEIFDVAETNDKQKIKLSVLEGTIMDSSTKNQVGTLIYDLTVLLNIIDNNIKAPRFIAHDGIFENLHKSYFLVFISFIERLIANKNDFQYILTLNERDFFNETLNFKENKIIKNSVIELTPNRKLFGEF